MYLHSTNLINNPPSIILHLHPQMLKIHLIGFHKKSKRNTTLAALNINKIWIIFICLEVMSPFNLTYYAVWVNVILHALIALVIKGLTQKPTHEWLESFNRVSDWIVNCITFKRRNFDKKHYIFWLFGGWCSLAWHVVLSLF